MKIVTFKLDPEDGLISLTIQPTTGRTTIDVAMALTTELEQSLLSAALGEIKKLMSEKSELTAGTAKV